MDHAVSVPVPHDIRELKTKTQMAIADRFEQRISEDEYSRLLQDIARKYVEITGHHPSQIKAHYCSAACWLKAVFKSINP